MIAETAVEVVEKLCLASHLFRKGNAERGEIWLMIYDACEM